MSAEAYAPADTNVYGKVAALSHRRRATASMAKIAGYLGLSKSTVERSVRRLGAPAPTDGVRELFTRRRTHEVTGTGQSAERWCRELGAGEAYVCAPVLAADALRPIVHRLYLGLRHAVVVRRHQPTLAELAQLLRHHGGQRAGQALDEDSVSDLLAELAALGWISVDERAGYRGRHLITVHDDPVRPAGEPVATPGPGDGSGPDLGDGSLASKEDPGLNDRGNNPPTAVLGIRRRRPTATSARDERDLVDTFGRRTGLDLTPAAWQAVHTALAPVRRELPALSGWEWERLVGAVLAQLGDGQRPERLSDRIQRRYARMRPTGTPDDGRPAIAHTARWLIGAALTRHGCPDPACETGTLWASGTDCPVCLLRREQADAQVQRLRELEASERRMAERRAQRQRNTDPAVRAHYTAARGSAEPHDGPAAGEAAAPAPAARPPY
ncbi:hypothetical protein JHN59_42340, partial [Streptomyces sp. MBT49]|uniref:hypothetical protein n=1 Tax=Streptomyces sp. MBT49 TaxID=1488380 RepID=UPI00190E4772